MTNDGMSADRFAAIVAAYGVDQARWPEVERRAATAMARTPIGIALLAAEIDLDARLEGWAIDRPGDGLIQRIAASAPERTVRPVVRPTPPARAWPRLWWPGLGLGAAAACGALSGALAIPIAAPPTHQAEADAYGWGYAQSVDVNEGDVS